MTLYELDDYLLIDLTDPDSYRVVAVSGNTEFDDIPGGFYPEKYVIAKVVETGGQNE